MLLPSLPLCIIDPPFIILIYNDLLTHLQLPVKNEDLTPLFSFGLLESVFREIVNRSRVYPRTCPPLFLSAVFVAEWRTGGLVRRLCGGLAWWPSLGRVIPMKENSRFKDKPEFLRYEWQKKDLPPITKNPTFPMAT